MKRVALQVQVARGARYPKVQGLNLELQASWSERNFRSDSPHWGRLQRWSRLCHRQLHLAREPTFLVRQRRLKARPQRARLQPSSVQATQQPAVHRLGMKQPELCLSGRRVRRGPSMSLEQTTAPVVTRRNPKCLSSAPPQ